MDAVISCGYCKQRVRRKTNVGRPPEYCSTACRRAAEYVARRQSRTFESYKTGFRSMGETEVRQLLADDPGFAEQLLELSETYLPSPDGRERVTDDWEALHLVFRKPRSFSVIGHDTPLPPTTDIDDAEASGDWWPMVQAALKSMTWQLANGFVPDMTEFF